MEDVGTRLRAARDRCKLTLDDVAFRTRIPSAVLTHIEDNAFDRLPAAVFTKGHLRAYAAAVQLDPEEIVSQYLEQWPEATHELPIFRAPATDAHEGARRIGAAIVGIAALVFAYSILRQPGERAATATVPQPAVAVAVPVATGNVAADSMPAAATADAGIRVDVEATADCWVSAVADGELVIHRLLLKGERAAIGAASELVVRIGDPGAFAYMLNGVRGRSLGNAGEPITVTITEQNYRTFLEETEPTSPLSEATAV